MRSENTTSKKKKEKTVLQNSRISKKTFKNIVNMNKTLMGMN